jgi:site-specific recombinase XerD
VIEQFSRYFHRRPDQLGPPSSVTQQNAALRFFYVHVLQRPGTLSETPYPKKSFRLPTVLSREEVTRLIDAALTPLHPLPALLFSCRLSTLAPCCPYWR